MPLYRDSESVLCEHAAPREIVFSIDGTGFIAVQVAAIACEGNEVSHQFTEFSGDRSLRSRLSNFSRSMVAGGVDGSYSHSMVAGGLWVRS